MIPKDGKFWVTKATSVKSKLFSTSDIQKIVKKAMVERMKLKYNVEWFDESGNEYPVRVFFNKDEATVAEIIGEAHQANTSPKFYNNEQALRSVVIMAYLSSVDDYIRFEELASGKGYIDLLFLPALQSSKPALIIELKWNKSAEKAVQQEQDQQYWKFAKQFRYKGKILLVGINYNSKTKKHTCKIKEIEVSER